MNVYVVIQEHGGYGASPHVLCQVFADLNEAMQWCESQVDSTLEWSGSSGCGLQRWESDPFGDYDDFRFSIERRLLVGA